MKRKKIFYLLAFFLVLFLPVQSMYAEEPEIADIVYTGFENPDCTFISIDGNSVSTKSEREKATVLIFGRTTCWNCQQTVLSVAQSEWVMDEAVRVVFAEGDGAALEEVKAFQADYGNEWIEFCYSTGTDISNVMFQYLQNAGMDASAGFLFPVTVLIDAENQVQEILTGKRSADELLAEMKKFADLPYEEAKPQDSDLQQGGDQGLQDKDTDDFDDGEFSSVETVITIGNDVYHVTDQGDSVVYKKSKGMARRVLIPDVIKVDGVSYRVTSIADEAFLGNENLRRVMIGNNVVSIGKEAFRDCSKLKKIEIKSKKLTDVEENAFQGIHAKAKIKVPKKMLKQYQKLLKGKGQGSKVKIVRA